MRREKRGGRPYITYGVLAFAPINNSPARMMIIIIIAITRSARPSPQLHPPTPHPRYYVIACGARFFSFTLPPPHHYTRARTILAYFIARAQIYLQVLLLLLLLQLRVCTPCDTTGASFLRGRGFFLFFFSPFLVLIRSRLLLLLLLLFIAIYLQRMEIAVVVCSYGPRCTADGRLFSGRCRCRRCPRRPSRFYAPASHLAKILG